MRILRQRYKAVFKPATNIAYPKAQCATEHKLMYIGCSADAARACKEGSVVGKGSTTNSTQPSAHRRVSIVNNWVSPELQQISNFLMAAKKWACSRDPPRVIWLLIYQLVVPTTQQDSSPRGQQLVHFVLESAAGDSGAYAYTTLVVSIGCIFGLSLGIARTFALLVVNSGSLCLKRASHCDQRCCDQFRASTCDPSRIAVFLAGRAECAFLVP